MDFAFIICVIFKPLNLNASKVAKRVIYYIILFFLTMFNAAMGA